MALFESLQLRQGKKKALNFSAFFLHMRGHCCNALRGRSLDRRSVEAREPDEAELTHFAKTVFPNAPPEAVLPPKCEGSHVKKKKERKK